MSSNQSWKHYGQSISLNDPVRCKTISAIRRSDIIGRVVQVRVGCGLFGSDVALLRMADGSLETFENEWFEKMDDAAFPALDCDSDSQEYTIQNKFPETGFIIESPKQPEKPGSFSIIITK